MDITAALTASLIEANLALTGTALIGVTLVVYGFSKTIGMLSGRRT